MKSINIEIPEDILLSVKLPKKRIKEELKKELALHLYPVSCIKKEFSPLINFSNIGRLEILQVLFGRIVVPEAVWEEIVVKGSKYPPSQLIKDVHWISRKDITFRELYNTALRDNREL